MKTIISTDMVYIKQSRIPNAGRGVFAKKIMHKGQTIEVCPVIEISNDELAAVDGSMLLTYVFFYGIKKDRAFLSLGFGSLYNHSSIPNARYVLDEKNQTIEFIAVKAILKDTEITFDYSSGNPKNSPPLWFIL